MVIIIMNSQMSCVFKDKSNSSWFSIGKEMKIL